MSNVPNTYKATLKRGAVYYLRDRAFLRDEEQSINDADYKHLKANAIDRITIPAQNEDERPEEQLRQKFQFVKIAATGDAPTETEGPGEEDQEEGPGDDQPEHTNIREAGSAPRVRSRSARAP